MSFEPLTVLVPSFLVDEKARLEHDIPIRNESSVPLRFSRIRQSCSCVGTATLGKSQLAAGEETRLHMDVDVRNRYGPQRLVVTLIEETGAEWTIALETIIYKRIALGDSGFTHFGLVNPGDEVVRQIELSMYTRAGQPPPILDSIRSDLKDLTVECGQVKEEILDGAIIVSRTPIRLVLRAPKRAGLGETLVRAKVSLNGRTEYVDAHVTWNVRELVSVRPAQVYFGQIDATATDPIRRRVILARSDKVPLAIKSLFTTCKGVQCVIEPIRDGGLAQVIVSLDPKSVRKTFWGELVVEMDDPKQPMLRIPVAAVVPR